MPQDDGYLAFDYLPDAVDADSDPTTTHLPDATWAQLIDVADPAEAVDIGTAASVRNQWRQEIEAYRKALDGGQLVAALGLADCIGRALDDWQGAAEILRAALVQAQERNDIDDTDRLIIQHQLAFWIYDHDGGEALQLASEAAAESERLLGPQDRTTLRCRLTLARCTGYTGNPTKALQIAGEVVDSYRRTVGDDAFGTLTSRYEVALWTEKCGAIHRAIELHQTLVADATNALGAGSLITLWSRSHVARLISAEGNPEEAVRLFEGLIADRTRLQGVDHGETHHEIEELQRARDALADSTRDNQA
jgi:tetratricopeptide (TPR) repeat protein